MKILSVFGTRPEAIKMAPVINALDADQYFDSLVCITGQHREMLDDALQLFSITPDFDLDVMKVDQNLTHITTTILEKLGHILNEIKPDRVLVHGDTTTSFAGALSAFYANVPVAHVEAGLRSGNIYSPWPEEMNRKLTDTICDLLFAPTESAKFNLLNSGVLEKNIFVTGNTVIDALLEISERIDKERSLQLSAERKFPFITNDKQTILVTGHRRENIGKGMTEICKALIKIAKRNDVNIIYPVHLNPRVKNYVYEQLNNLENIYLVPPLNYLTFVFLMKNSKLILTDSGGIQEEAPSLGKPVLVMREVTERQEAVDAGTVRLVGTNYKKIISGVDLLLENESIYNEMSCSHNPYGDGNSRNRILRELRSAS
ncbi:MAG: UDP-N-acetylglucosamine 2-epimerase (non-hydrolyzing) [Pseudomonadota bacterium]|nr:UDP-N-acetylglucosamine 2-epimerase (non-hydrolyzing) [Pseudomonadota bacterium]